MPSWVYSFIAVSVTVIWTAANVVAIVHSTQVDAQLHVVMGAVVGGAWGGQAVQKRKERRLDE